MAFFVFMLNIACILFDGWLNYELSENKYEQSIQSTF